MTHKSATGLQGHDPHALPADVATALSAARTQATAGDRILVFGSFHTAAAALAVLRGGR